MLRTLVALAFAIPAASIAIAAGPPPFGEYVCHDESGKHVPSMNIMLRPPDVYEDAKKVRGSYIFDAATSVITFSGGAADGLKALYADSTETTGAGMTYAKPDGSFEGGIFCAGAG